MRRGVSHPVIAAGAEMSHELKQLSVADPIEPGVDRAGDHPTPPRAKQAEQPAGPHLGRERHATVATAVLLRGAKAGDIAPADDRALGAPNHPKAMMVELEKTAPGLHGEKDRKGCDTIHDKPRPILQAIRKGDKTGEGDDQADHGPSMGPMGSGRTKVKFFGRGHGPKTDGSMRWALGPRHREPRDPSGNPISVMVET